MDIGRALGPAGCHPEDYPGHGQEQDQQDAARPSLELVAATHMRPVSPSASVSLAVVDGLRSPQPSTLLAYSVKLALKLLEAVFMDPDWEQAQ